MGIKMKHVYIYPNTTKKEIERKIKQLTTFILECGCKIYMHECLKDTFYGEFDINFVPFEECIENAEVIIVLGGDGTILRIAKKAAEYNVPILGINFGTVGFISELEISEYAYLAKVFNGKYILDNRMMLKVDVIRDNEIIYTKYALNDAVVIKGNAFRTVRVGVLADDIPVSNFTGDGVIISTPTGSTAYSLSAGGPVIEPAAENICVTPICAHALQAKSYVFAPQRKIEISTTDAKNEYVFVSVDGEDGYKISDNDRVIITKASLELKLIRVKDKSFYSVLKEKL